MYINKDVLDTIPKNVRYSKAVRYYNMQQVKLVDITYIDEHNFSANSKVDGSFSDVYNVSVTVKKGRVYDYKCECLDNNNMCKHVIATLMEAVKPHITPIKEEIEKEKRKRDAAFQLLLKQREESLRRYEYERKYNSCISLIEKFSNNIEKNDKIKTNGINLKKIQEEALSINLNKLHNDVENGSLKLVCRISVTYNNTLEVSFKIGNTKMYVIKNLFDFVSSFEIKQPIVFSEKFSFVVNEDKFCESSKKIFNLVIKYAKMIKYSMATSKYGIVNTKSVLILPAEKDELFDTILNEEIEITYENNKENYLITNEDMLVKFKLEKNNEEKEYSLVATQNYDFFTYSNKYIYIGCKGKIYRVNNDNNKLIDLLNFSINNNSPLIPEDKINLFSDLVLDKAEKYLDNNDGQASSKSVINSKLGVKVFFDLDENGNILSDIKFCYGDFERNPLIETNVENSNIAFDYEKEHVTLLMFFQDGFVLSNKKNKFIMKDEDKIYDFLSNKVETYMREYEVLATDNFFKKQVKKPKLGTVGIRVDSDLLNIDFSKLDFNPDEIKQVMQSYNIKKKYHRLKDGTFLNLERNEELDLINDISTNMDVDFKQIKNGVIKTNINRSMYLQKLLEKNSNTVVEKDEEYNGLINNIENKNYCDNINVPIKIGKNLRDYQKTGYKWLKVLEAYKFGGILADDMGLGKTLQVISVISSYIEENKKNRKPSIVICPSSLSINWLAEVEKWCGKIKTLIISGNASERKSLIDKMDNYDLIITSYDLLKRDIEYYKEKECVFQYIIADEAQYIKNFTTQNATALKSLRGNCKFALTGTPIENSISELWSIFDYIMPGYLYNYHKFKKNYEEPIIKNGNEEILNKLKMLINPFILRRLKKDVLTELPDKNITILNNEMTSEQQKIYVAYLSQIKKEVSEELTMNGFEKSKFKILMLLTRLRQICCHPSLFIDDYKDGSGKLEQCLDILNESISSGHKVLLFSQYTSMFEIIEKELEKLNIKYFKLTGSTDVSKRVDMVNEFNSSNEIKVFLISLKAGGTGLNLTGADVVIHYDPWWNLSAENQATDRAYRIGQKNSVQVYKMITKNTIEEKISALQQKKAKISDDLLSTEETFINKLSKDELMNLFE
ncbi:MAG: DEAD/DEAH box helicase [Clostridia bacterium]